MKTASELVANGAALLDEHLPGWHERIDLDTLDISSCDKCMLGQLFGRYGIGKDALGLKTGDNHGFALPYSMFDSLNWGVLDKAWADEIGSRRAKANDWGTARVEELAVA